MRYASIREMDITNGEGIGVSLFVQGCHFHCPGCFNPETWDFNGGKEWTPEIEKEFIELAGRNYVQRISILGGEPLADENCIDVLNLIGWLKTAYPNKKIWLYTGYKFEDLLENYSITKMLSIVSVDVLVDGQFEIDKQDLFNKSIVWAGSTNQRIISPYLSCVYGKIVPYLVEE